ncbi:hypothetical protein ALC62_06610, partial [Cyphomyrmex costatus]
IRRGNSGRGEGATDDSRRASRRKSIHGAGGVSTAVFAAAVLFPSYCRRLSFRRESIPNERTRRAKRDRT